MTHTVILSTAKNLTMRVLSFYHMKKLFIVANWKSNKNISEAKEWIEEVESSKLKAEGPSGVQSNGKKEIIVCASFTLLPDLKSLIFNPTGTRGLKSSIKLGVQDISPFGPGAYTGEVNGEQIKEFADYVLIGHSEQRKYFHEDTESINKKIEMALKYNINPIVCVQDEKEKIPQKVSFVAYDPAFAIGTGNPDTPENANTIAEEIKRKNNNVKYVLYGGSVNSKNVGSFTNQSSIDGVLVGGASLDAKEFLEIIKNA